ncbi:MAG TPA: GNAT family N-acetyltransferase [Thermohalobaculum sp.]|nr:GNAT family N-acetyltransferase [Thermohalobaculum sp.]
MPPAAPEPPAAPGAPGTPRLMEAIDATWPPAEFAALGAWTLRRGAGGGQRVSAASTGDATADPGAAAEAMRAWGQAPLFRVGEGQAALDDRLAGAGYRRHDPVVLYAAPVAALADGRDETARVIRVRAPLAIVDEIWLGGGIGPGRRAVMDRAPDPKMTLLARASDRPAGVAFVGIDRDIAMIHAIEVVPAHRRLGAGEILLRGAASFAAEHGAAWLTLAVTEANATARALYAKLGMGLAGRYHYRLGAE